MTKLALSAPCADYDEPSTPAEHKMELLNADEAVGNYLCERYAYRGFIIAREATLYRVYVDDHARSQRDWLYVGLRPEDGCTWIDEQITGIDELAGAIFDTRCPGIAYLVEDVPLYRRAAVDALRVLGVLDNS